MARTVEAGPALGHDVGGLVWWDLALAAPLVTEREREIFTLVARGFTNQEIAHHLTLAEATVKSHVAAVLRKLGLRDRVQVVIYAYEHGLAQPQR